MSFQNRRNAGIGTPGTAGGIATSGGMNANGINANGIAGMNANGRSVIMSDTNRPMKMKSPRMPGIAMTVPMSPSQQVMNDIPSLMKPQMDRMSQQEPERFTQFDHRFEFERMKNRGQDFRQEFDDDERERFLPQILSARGVDIPLIEYIFGLAYNEELAGEECLLQPNAPGIWEIGADGCWFQVSMADERLIEEISRLRGDRHQAIIVQ